MVKTKSEPIELPEEDFDKLLRLVGSEPKEPTRTLVEIFENDPDINIEV